VTLQTKVAILDGGSLGAREHMVYWQSASDAPMALPVYSVLIAHSDGNFLFDTGFDLEKFRANISPQGAIQAPAQTLPHQLSLLGLAPTEIHTVINSHYHFDHCGGNHLCSCASNLCHKAELAAALDPQPFERLGYSDRSFVPPAPDPARADDLARRLQTIEGDQEIAKGIFLFETPGHTLGHYSLMVRLSGRRPMLFTADASYTRRALDTMVLSTAHIDPVRGIASMRRLRSLAEEYDAELFFPHDPDEYATYLKAPGWYS
jgi:4-pyridoxolactonase